MANEISRGTETYGWTIERQAGVTRNILVAGIESQICSGVRSEADARLIAAAPDILEALKTAALVIHAGHDGLFAECIDCVCAANRAAITKAGA